MPPGLVRILRRKGAGQDDEQQCKRFAMEEIHATDLIMGRPANRRAGRIFRGSTGVIRYGMRAIRKRSAPGRVMPLCEPVPAPPAGCTFHVPTPARPVTSNQEHG